MKKVAINGFGRIGRLVFRILAESPNIEIMAINDLSDPEEMAYLLKYDSVYKRYDKKVTFDEEYIIVDNRKIKVFAEKNPSNLPWRDLEIDLVFECTGAFTHKDDANKHLLAGAKKVLISAPGKGDMKTIVYNVNEDTLDSTDRIVSAASCTTNCLAPVLKVMNDNFEIQSGYMTTVHAVTSNQNILDAQHKSDITSRRGRSAMSNIVPTSTGAATAIGKVIPEIEGKLSGSALRVPVDSGSVIDLTLKLKTKATKEEINQIFKHSANETLNYTEEPLVSSDIKGERCGAIVDGLLTEVLAVDKEQLIKIVAWYDNEFGYSAQMVRTAEYLMGL